MSVLEVSDRLPFENQSYPLLLLLIPAPYAVTLLYTTMQARKGCNLSLFFGTEKDRQNDLPADQTEYQKVNYGQTETK